MFLGKEVRVLLVGQAKQSYLELKERKDKEAQSIIRSIDRVKDLLKTNPQFGDPLSKDKIPDELRKQGIYNLYRAELSNFWRMLYTLEGNKIEIFVFILRISDHPTYDKFLGYKGH